MPVWYYPRLEDDVAMVGKSIDYSEDERGSQSPYQAQTKLMGGHRKTEPLSACADAEKDERNPNAQKVLGQPIDLFGSATLHIVSEVAAGVWRLLFAKVELLPSEIPAPVCEKPIPGPQVNKKQTRVFSHHISTNINTALDWYEQARSNHSSLFL